MRCSKCGKYLGLIQKFCPKCGTAVTPEQKKKNLIYFGIWVLIFVILIPIIYFLLEKYDPAAAEHSNLYAFLTSAFISFVTISWLLIIYFLIYSLVRSFIRQPIFGSIIIGAIFIVAGFGGYLYWVDYSEQQFNTSLILIQDNLAEATAAKIMGDSLVEKKKLITASWERVGIEARMVFGRLKDLTVPKELSGYQIAAIIWTAKIEAGAKDHNPWKDVGDDPGEFVLALSDSQAQKLFKQSNNKLAELKEFGDNAIKTNNDMPMLYIGAKIMVQRHWLNGLAHSTKGWFLSLNSFNLVPATLAAFEDVPPVGPGTDVTCQVCNDSSVHWTAQLRSQYNCNKCSDSQTPVRPLDQPNNNQPQNNGGQNQNSNQNKPAQPSPNQPPSNNTGNVSNSGASSGQGGGDYQTPKRQVCIGRGGTSTGNSATNVYCLEDVISSTEGIDASAINIAEGNAQAKNGWYGEWHQLEGLGVISSDQSAVSSSGNTPTMQKFYDDCAAAGGEVGGAAISKSRLPTTEFGYTCGYKNKDGQTCWDYLTYSGGRYMGGNPGCEEQGLLPNTAEEQAKKASGGSQWDGHYVGSFTARCQTTLPERPTPSFSTPIDFTVVNNTTFDIEGNTYVNIDQGGYAIESLQMAQGTAYGYGTFYYHFSSGGLSASGSIDAVYTREDGTYYGSCGVSGSASKK